MIEVIKSMIAWSSKKGEPCGQGFIKGTTCRNWRTWLGHSAVVDSVTAVSLVPLIFTSAPWAVVVGTVGWLSGVVYYWWREFGKNGNFYDETEEGILDRNDKKTDSVLDFAVPLFTSSFLKFNFHPLVVLIVAVVQVAATYLIYKHETQ